MPKFEVPITGPDGSKGTITVNASDAQAAVKNAAQGGNTATGSATPVAAGPNAQTSSINYTAGGGGGGSTTYNAGAQGPATTGSTKADPGTNWGFTGGGVGGTPEDRTKSIYEGKDNETLQQWMQRVFRQSTRDFGGALSPDADNPYGRTPYANWFQNRYTDVVPANLLLSKLLTNSGMGEDFAPGMEAGMKNFQSTGEGRGFGTGVEGAQGNLGKLNDLMNSFANENTAGLSPEQVTALGGLMDSPQNTTALVNAQLAGSIGANPLASKYLSQIESQSMNDYFDDVVGQSPKTNGTFLQNLLRRINMAK